MVFVGVFRKEHEVADECQKELHDACRTVERAHEEAFDIDDHAFSEFGLFQSFDPWEAVRKIGRLVDFVVLRRIDF